MSIIVSKSWWKRFCGWISIELRRTVTIFTLLIIVILSAGAVFSHIQDGWNYTDGVYFMWISISTIGYGDLHPDVVETTLWANIIIWVGLAMTALVIGSAQDYFSKKLKKWRQEDQIDVNDLTLDLNSDGGDTAYTENSSEMGRGYQSSVTTVEESRHKRRDNGDSRSTMSTVPEENDNATHYRMLNSPTVDEDTKIDKENVELIAGK